MQQTHHIGKSGCAEPRAELLGDGGATHDLAAFQYQGLQTRLGEVGATDEPVVSRSDNDHIIGSRHLALPSIRVPCCYRVSSPLRLQLRAAGTAPTAGGEPELLARIADAAASAAKYGKRC